MCNVQIEAKHVTKMRPVVVEFDVTYAVVGEKDEQTDEIDRDG